MAVVGDILFYRQDQIDLDTVLRNQGNAGVRKLVEKLPDSAFAKHSDDELVAQVFAKAHIAPLTLALEAAKTKVQEVTVDTRNIFGDFAQVKGLSATKEIPFTGEEDLWHLRPSSFDLNPPRGEVGGKTIVVGIEVTEDQSDQAVAYVADTIKKIQENIERQNVQIKPFNDSLPSLIHPVVQQRRARLGKAADLLKKLQG
jgi:hypothetical protein